MMHPHTELRFINEEIGHGVIALRDIPAGTITWVQDELDRVLTPSEVEDLGELYAKTLDTYCFRNGRGEWILCWDRARFVNHSFRSNCMTTAFEFEIAIRDIAAGEELTDDYGYLNIMQPFEAIDEGAGRTTVYPDDLLRHHRAWDKQLRRAWPHIPQVAQPLRSLITPDLWERVTTIADDPTRMPSILECYYRGTTEAPERAIRTRKWTATPQGARDNHR
ncbi:MAG: SET domain-containing protein [Phycisphaerales bacterium]